MTRAEAINAILEEQARASKIPGNEDNEWKQKNDFIAYTIAYLGRASEGVHRNEREGQDFKTNMVKAAGLILTALEKFA